jgi:hypothetical protein
MSEIIAARCFKCKAIIPHDSVFCPSCGKKSPVRAPGSEWAITKFIGSIVLFIVFVKVLMSLAGSVQSNTPVVSPVLRDQCLRVIRASVNNPSTLDIHYLTGYAVDKLPDGTQRMVQTFSAQNGFGLRQTFDAQCILKPNGKFDFRIVEQEN